MGVWVEPDPGIYKGVNPIFSHFFTPILSLTSPPSLHSLSALFLLRRGTSIPAVVASQQRRRRRRKLQNFLFSQIFFMLFSPFVPLYLFPPLKLSRNAKYDLDL